MRIHQCITVRARVVSVWRVVCCRQYGQATMLALHLDLLNKYCMLQSLVCIFVEKETLRVLTAAAWGPAILLKESPCPRGPIYKFLSLDHKVLENFQGLRILQTVRNVWWWWCDAHKFFYRRRAWGYGEECLTYWYMSASKPFFTVTQCWCPRGKSLSLSSRTNLQVLVLVLGPQVLDNITDTAVNIKHKFNNSLSNMFLLKFCQVNFEWISPCVIVTHIVCFMSLRV